jgi:thiamine kinase-like enzyme
VATTLPRPIQLKLEQTIAQWRHWRCDPPLPGAPHIESQLTAGISNFSVLVRAASQQFVIRIDGVNPATNGLNRQTEWRALQVAHAARLAPCPRYFNPELGSLVCDYLPHDQSQSLQIPDLAGLLRAIHDLPARHHRLDLGERLLRYENLLAKANHPMARDLMHHREALWQIVEETRQAEQTAVLCHNDLTPANQLYSGGKLWALDWEYCAMGSPWFDLAVAITGHSLDEVQTADLLFHYLQQPATAGELNLVQQHSSLCRYLELLWHLGQSAPGADSVCLEGKLALLEANL